MIKKTEIKYNEQTEETRIIFYDDQEDSFGYKLNKLIAYSLYEQLRELFKNLEGN
jgi:hypothetical protein